MVFAVLAGLLVLLGFVANAVANIGDAGLEGTTFEEGVWLSLVYAAVLAGMGALVHWGPKLWGRLLPIKAVLPLALLTFLGGVLSSLPMMVAGFADQPGGVGAVLSGVEDAFPHDRRAVPPDPVDPPGDEWRRHFEFGELG